MFVVDDWDESYPIMVINVYMADQWLNYVCFSCFCFRVDSCGGFLKWMNPPTSNPKQISHVADVDNDLLGVAYLVGGIPTPLKKYENWKSVGIIIPNIWTNKTCSKSPTSANQLYIFGGTLYEEKFNISICAMIRTWYLCHDECTLKRRVTIHFSGKVTNDKQCFDHGTYDSMARIVFGCEHFGG